MLINPRRRQLLHATLGGFALSAFPRHSPAVGWQQVASQAAALDQLHSLVVAQAGQTLLAEHLRGPGLERIANVKSVSKTVMAALVGVALYRGLLQRVDQPIVPLLGDWVPDEADPQVADITLDHLLTMRAGLERTSGANYGRWVNSPNWVRFILSQPFVDRPGGRFLYSTGSFHLLSAILTRVSGRSTLALAQEWLGEPLGIQIPAWTRDPQGIYMGGNNMGFTPRGLLRFGELYQRQGRWNDQQVFAPDWAATSWQPRTRSPWSGDDYGYGWFLTQLGGQSVRYGRGYGGQMLYVVPDLDLTVVIISDPNRPARSGGYVADLHRLLGEAVIPAVMA